MIKYKECPKCRKPQSTRAFFGKPICRGCRSAKINAYQKARREVSRTLPSNERKLKYGW